jgi:hypothetical protein
MYAVKRSRESHRLTIQISSGSRSERQTSEVLKAGEAVDEARATPEGGDQLLRAVGGDPQARDRDVHASRT